MKPIIQNVYQSLLFIFRIQLASAEDFDKVWQCYLEDFVPGEPMSRSCGFLNENTGKGDLGNGWKMLYKAFMGPMLSKGTSVIAVNEKDEIVGKHWYHVTKNRDYV